MRWKLKTIRLKQVKGILWQESSDGVEVENASLRHFIEHIKGVKWGNTSCVAVATGSLCFTLANFLHVLSPSLFPSTSLPLVHTFLLLPRRNQTLLSPSFFIKSSLQTKPKESVFNTGASKARKMRYISRFVFDLVLNKVVRPLVIHAHAHHRVPANTILSYVSCPDHVLLKGKWYGI